MFEVEYTVRRLSATEFEVAKFTDRKAPANVYRLKVLNNGLTWRCDCPGAFRHMGSPQEKHAQLVQRWLQDGEPILTYYKE